MMYLTLQFFPGTLLDAGFLYNLQSTGKNHAPLCPDRCVRLDSLSDSDIL